MNKEENLCVAFIAFKGGAGNTRIFIFIGPVFASSSKSAGPPSSTSASQPHNIPVTEQAFETSGNSIQSLAFNVKFLTEREVSPLQFPK